MPEHPQKKTIRHLVLQAFSDFDIFCSKCSRVHLRAYQKEPAYAILQSLKEKAGRTFVIMFPRQSGKNEIQAHLEAYLLCLYHLMNVEMVKVSPTWKPQTLNAMRRLERALGQNDIARKMYSRESGYIYRVGLARITFFSGQPRSNIVGATANLMLEVDEAQDILPSKYDKDIAPMAASTNATRVFWGTAWTSRTLLARELKAARAAQEADGVRRVFILNADDVRKEVPEYGEFVDGQIQLLGRNHPMVRTQYFSEEIDAQGGLFPPERVALMKGRHAPAVQPEAGKLYALTIDLAGEDEAVVADPEDLQDDQQRSNPRRDSTALTVFEVDVASAEDALINRPTYKVVFRREWVGVKHARLYAEIKAIAQLYEARYLVVDATGVGAGLASFLAAALGERVIPFEFNTRTKSDLLWGFLGMIDSGRFKDYHFLPEGQAEAGDTCSLLAQAFWRQVSFCEFEILPGPQKRARWGVPDGTRDPASGELVHDDLLISAALATALDQQDWSVSAPTFVIQAADPLDEMDKGF